MTTSNNESFEELERRLTRMPMRGAPAELRDAVLAEANRELAATRWDRRLARVAAVLLVVGVSTNTAIGLRSPQSANRQQSQLASERSQQSLVEAAVVMAEATDAATGSRYARQLAAMSGRELTDEEAAAIDAAIERASTHTTTNGNRG